DLPKGIHTLVYRNFDDEGFEPSGGEGQKIALARALFKNAPIVILDEPAAALDPRAEYEMYQGFNSLIEGKTAVYISHRLSSTRFCDSIAVFNNGEIAERGTHEELLNRSGLYAELWEMQAKYYIE
ncbi:MAG: ATP-binding cassette domain-containing protein, partial [Clostridiales bacterium]|nr:ATP-binding cassette domain-containing protein [Clostridiales bacterium]